MSENTAQAVLTFLKSSLSCEQVCYLFIDSYSMSHEQKAAQYQLKTQIFTTGKISLNNALFPAVFKAQDLRLLIWPEHAYTFLFIFVYLEIV